MKRYRLKKDLPTFKAGEEFELTPCGALVQIINGRTGVCAYAASTLDKFPNILEEWFEEIKPKEPLIKDTECREIMRLWADRCGVKTVVLFGLEFRCGGRSISFGADFGLEHLKAYTIDELCGEEEE